MSDLESRLRTALNEETSELVAHPTMAEDLVARGRKVRRRRRVAGGVACVAVLGAMVPVWRAVDHSSGSLQPVGPTATGPTPSTVSTATTPALHEPGWKQLPLAVGHAPARQATVLNLRVGRHGSYDRVVIDFLGPISGYRIDREPTLAKDGSGDVVKLPGTDKVVIRLSPAVAHGVRGRPLYDGPQHAKYTMPALRGVAFLGDFEGVVSLGLGVDHLSDVRVFELTHPSRLVIDLHH